MTRIDDDITTNHPTNHRARPPQPAPVPGADAAVPVARFPAGLPPSEAIVYGPDIADEATLRLIGQVEGKRILVLGTGNGSNAVLLARRGAKVISVDPDPSNLEAARALADQHELKVELHQGEIGDVAFVRADTIDLVLSVHALAEVDGIDRVFRQVHRVLRPECSFLLSLPHPAWSLIDPTSPDPLRITRSWFDPDRTDGARGFAELVGGLHRANFRVEQVIEPPPGNGPRSPLWSEAMRYVPATIVIRARKQGI